MNDGIHLTSYLYLRVNHKDAAKFCVGISSLPSWLRWPSEFRPFSVRSPTPVQYQPRRDTKELERYSGYICTSGRSEIRCGNLQASHPRWPSAQSDGEVNPGSYMQCPAERSSLFSAKHRFMKSGSCLPNI